MSRINYPKKIFLGWQRPFLDSACDWLICQSQGSSHVDLSHLNILSTVGRAARHLIEKLVTKAEKQGLGFSPPNLISLSGLYKSLLPDQRLVNSVDSNLIFFSLLQNCDTQIIESLFPNSRERPTELELFKKAILLQECYREFTKNGEAALDSIDKLLNSTLISNEARWQTLRQVFTLFHSELKRLGLLDTQSALQLLEARHPTNSTRVILLACYDLTQILKRTILSGYSEVTALIFAPETEQAGFDEIGCVRAEYWQKRSPCFDFDTLKVCYNSKDQAYQVFSDLSSIKTPFLASEVTLGALEPGLDRHIEAIAKTFDLPVHLPNKKVLGCCEPFLILSRSLQFKMKKTFYELAALLTLPSFSEKLPNKNDPIVLLNNYREDHLQPMVTGDLPACSAELTSMLQEVENLLKVFEVSQYTLIEWLSAAKSFLLAIYRESLNSDAELLLEKLESLSSEVSSEQISIEVFHSLIFSLLAETAESIQEISEGSLAQLESIDVVGWLELALDDAPYTYVLGFNEGFVPASPKANSFLPDQARKLINLQDNDYRFARDLYIFEALRCSKKNLKLFASKLSLGNDPLLPSRLSLQSSAEAKAKTIINFFESKLALPSESRSSSEQSFKELYASNFLPQKIIRPNPLPISVTSLSDYLTCPYLFYLKNVLRLESSKPDSRELSALQFGSLLHELIAGFSNSDFVKLSSAEKIEAYLLSQLRTRFEKHFGKNPFAEVLVQYHQVASRLKAFSKWQALWSEQGWQVYKVEMPFLDSGFEIKTEAGLALLKGRIDRIDYNPKTSEYMVVDFKSGDHAPDPEKAWSKRKGWLDLQLPLYYFYAKEILGLQNVKLALLPISASPEELHIKIASWDETHLDSARETLLQVVNCIINQQFWPPKIRPEQAWDFEDIYRANQ